MFGSQQKGTGKMSRMQGIPVVGYIRVSRVGDREGDSFLSPDLQQASLERTCAANGLILTHVLTELDKSGGDATRPLWNQAIEEVVTGKVKGLVCWNWDRFARSQIDGLLAAQAIEDAGGKVYTEEGSLSKLDRGIRLAIAEDYRDRVKAGFRRARESAFERGVYLAGKVPFGYRRNENRGLEPDPETAYLVAELFGLRVNKLSWAKLAMWLGEQGHPHSINGVRNIIRNETYLGMSRFEGTLKKTHEPLVSKKLWDAANAVQGQRFTPRTERDEVLLRGLATCGTCGHTLKVTSTTQSGKRHVGYVCKNVNCEKRAFANASDADKVVIGRIFTFLSEQASKHLLDSREGVSTTELRQAEKDYEEATYALEDFRKDRKSRQTLGAEVWNEWLEDYVTAVAVAEAELERLKGTPAYETLVDLETFWKSWTYEDRMTWLEKVIRDCIIVPNENKRDRHHAKPVAERIALRLHGATETHIEVFAKLWAMEPSSEKQE